LACCLCLCLVKEETFFSTPDLSHERKSKKIFGDSFPLCLGFLVPRATLLP
jgi:hypothetical protein